MLITSIQSVSRRRKKILQNIDFKVSPGEFVTVIGRNGCGKSTLLSAMAGLLPYDGSVVIDGREVSAMTMAERAVQISFMLQMLRSPHVTVEELVAFGRYPRHSRGTAATAEDREIMENAIRTAELEPLRNCYVDRISGGEQRRAYLGMQLAQNTPVMLLDESTAFMDADHENHFLTLLRELCRREKKILVTVMHSLDHAVQFSDRILLLDGGTLVFDGTPDELTAGGLIQQVFGLHPYSAEDENGHRKIFFA